MYFISEMFVLTLNKYVHYTVSYFAGCFCKHPRILSHCVLLNATSMRYGNWHYNVLSRGNIIVCGV
jgi:hypothetical protein